MRSVEDDTWLGTPVIREPKKTYVSVNKSAFWFKSIEENKMQLRSVWNFDPKVTACPKGLINWGIKSCISVFLNKIESKSKKLTPPYAKKMEEKKEFYDFLATKISLWPSHPDYLETEERQKLNKIALVKA